MNDFIIKHPQHANPENIELLSLQIVKERAINYLNYTKFSVDEQSVINRMIHATTCFDAIIDNIYFTNNSIETLKRFLSSGASIVTDTNMIKSGINKIYTEKFNNQVICKINDPEIARIAQSKSITRSTAFIRSVLEGNKDKKLILCCGNAPTFIFSAIETIIKASIKKENIFLIAMPVGFINVLESKIYAIEFMKHFGIQGIAINSNYGGSTLVVSAINAVYKMI